MFMEVKIQGERLGSDLQALPMFKITLTAPNTCTITFDANTVW